METSPIISIDSYNNTFVETLKMASAIKDVLCESYDDDVLETNIDVAQLIKICDYYLDDSTDLSESSVDIYQLRLTPENNIITKEVKSKKSNNSSKKDNIKYDANFFNKYAVVIKIIYCAYKFDIDPFKTNVKSKIILFKNNYDMKKSFVSMKKSILKQIIDFTSNGINNPDRVFHADYEDFYSSSLKKIKILDKIIVLFNTLINEKLLEET
jgi:hypothetical protein